MGGKALEVALALWRMPSMRTALRQRPLPDDIGELVEMAAGASARIGQAAARVDATPEQLLEAVRFYASEILMHDRADAYRVLGVDADATSRQIKAHHRALQQWLHPDRRGNQWASVYATRVNVAWGELRSAERRAAYDARLAEGLLAAAAGAEPRRVLVADWRAAPVNHSQWHGWAALVAVIAVCAVLIVLIERQASDPAPEWVVASDDAPDHAPEPVQLDLAALAGRVASQLSIRQRAAAAEKPLAVPVDAPEAITIEQDPAAALAWNGKPAAALAAPVARDSAPPPAAASSVLAPVDASAPKPIEKARVAAPPRPAARQSPAIDPAAAVSAAPATAMALAPGADVKPDSAPAAVDALERVHLAHLRGREVTRYLTGPSSAAPPIWRSVAAHDAAAAVRVQLDDGRSRIGRMFNATRFGEPDWRIGPAHATMTAAIQRNRVGASADPGTLHVKLAWREGMWLVDTIEVENLP